ncbi:antiviral reverse transcriptase Drt3a [Shewanella xiamenensis]|uniref:antiviral reverse transcriptase Drt3a n=1 Tax=Shewanella xiamenensis TaxID=332186 RepID=UPI0004D9273A|nr:antiviral reverse transcriptase Drt3a [Shewanella xiamenensis]KEK29872.1 hypothetical protein SXM_0467 [Shewanella xiamenensis]
MLKQAFDKEQVSKVMQPTDVWKWQLLKKYGGVDNAISHILASWKQTSLNLSPLTSGRAKGKSTFHFANIEDHFAVRLLDRFIRRVYKIRQSDRNRIVKQLISVLKDSGEHHVLRLDIKDCYESIKMKSLIEKIENDLILAPECIRLLKSISNDLIKNHSMEGLPRGLCISPTLAELYLEILDKKISSIPEVIYSARYVDDIIIIIPKIKKDSILTIIEEKIHEMNLSINTESCKYYSENSKNANFEFLGYAISVSETNNKPNSVSITISKSKLNKIKSRIAKSFSSYKHDANISLLKRRLEYISMLKVVKEGVNGNLFAGIALNYKYVTDEFKCLKPLDGFLSNQINHHRYSINPTDKARINKISIYANVTKLKIGNFTKSKTSEIMQVWKNA